MYFFFPGGGFGFGGMGFGFGGMGSSIDGVGEGVLGGVGGRGGGRGGGMSGGGIFQSMRKRIGGLPFLDFVQAHFDGQQHLMLPAFHGFLDLTSRLMSAGCGAAASEVVSKVDHRCMWS